MFFFKNQYCSYVQNQYNHWTVGEIRQIFHVMGKPEVDFIQNVHDFLYYITRGVTVWLIQSDWDPF